MGMLSLDELERLANAASHRPWRVRRGDRWDTENLFEITTAGGTYIGETLACYNGEANAEYIASACNAGPELIKLVRKLEQQRDWLASFIDAHMPCDSCPYHDDGGCEYSGTSCLKVMLDRAQEEPIHGYRD